MQTRPDKAALLEAVARFLEREVKPAIKDPALSFRVLVAANLAAVVAAEIGAEDAAGEAEFTRLAALLPSEAARFPDAHASREERRRALDALNRALADGIRRGIFEGDRRRGVWDHVLLTLRSELATSSPRFDTSAEIE